MSLPKTNYVSCNLSYMKIRKTQTFVLLLIIYVTRHIYQLYSWFECIMYPNCWWIFVTSKTTASSFYKCDAYFDFIGILYSCLCVGKIFLNSDCLWYVWAVIHNDVCVHIDYRYIDSSGLHWHSWKNRDKQNR